jgi:prevent-host-death family protein
LVVVYAQEYDYDDHSSHLRLNAMSAGCWTVAEAKARFSQVIEEARAKGPQTVTRNGRLAVVVVSAEEWERRTRRQGTLADFFAESPLRDSGIEIEPRGGRLRDVDF